MSNELSIRIKEIEKNVEKYVMTVVNCFHPSQKPLKINRHLANR